MGETIHDLQDKIIELEKTITELKEEDTRLCTVISNISKERGQLQKTVHYRIQITDKSERKKHYGVNGLEPIDAMKMGLFTYLEYIGFLKGNIIKYVCRCDYKNGIEDLYKARDYIDYLIDAYKKKGDLND